MYRLIPQIAGVGQVAQEATYSCFPVRSSLRCVNSVSRKYGVFFFAQVIGIRVVHGSPTWAPTVYLTTEKNKRSKSQTPCSSQPSGRRCFHRDFFLPCTLAVVAYRFIVRHHGPLSCLWRRVPFLWELGVAVALSLSDKMWQGSGGKRSLLHPRTGTTSVAQCS